MPRPWSGRYAVERTRECLAWWGTACHLCSDTETPADSADHVIPRSKGGTDELANLRPAHQQCNRQRGNMWLHEWFDLHPLTVVESLPPSRDW